MERNQINIIDVTSKNVSKYGVFCIKDKDAAGSQAKIKWCGIKGNEELRLKIILDSKDKQIGFIEYIPAEFAWRPIEADNYMFIQCIAVYVKEARNKNIGSTLIKICEDEAKALNKLGVCVITSNGSFMANKTIFEKNGYQKVEELGRFDLMVKKFDKKNLTPKLINWENQLKKYKGWNLVYTDQCPWHVKSVADIQVVAKEYNIDLKVKRIKNSAEAKKSPSGFGSYALINDGKLLGDHYLSSTRFKNILKQELSGK